MPSEALEGWRESALGDLCQIAIGGTPPRHRPEYWATNHGGHPWVAISDMRNAVIIRTKERITDAGVANSNVKPVAAGTVLMSFKLTIGRVAVAGTDLFTNEAIAAFQPGAKLDNSFLPYWLEHIVANADTDQAIKGATLNKKKLAALSGVLAPIGEQRRIAEVLRSVDEAIAAADAAQEVAKQVSLHVRAELMERARQRFDEIVVANAIAKNRGEKLKKLQTSDYQDEGAVPIIDQGASFICGYTDDQSALWPYALPVIVFGDHTRILKFVDFPFAIGADGTQCLTPTAGLDARFFYFALQSLDLRGEGYARHFKLLKEQTIPLPDMPTQLEIADQLSAMEQSIAAGAATRQRLQDTKRALMSDLLSGRVRVPA
ncbi:MAG: restriction endonuclease subunit S [Tsuneonella sp.]